MAEMIIDLNPILNKVGAFIKMKAVKMCPVDMGELRASIDYEISGNSVRIFATAEQAEEMEYGKPPEPQGIYGQEAQDIADWAKRHKTNPWGTIKYIEKHGIKVGTAKQPLHITSFGRDSYRPFLRPALYMNMPEIKQIIINEIKVQIG